MEIEIHLWAKFTNEIFIYYGTSTAIYNRYTSKYSFTTKRNKKRDQFLLDVLHTNKPYVRVSVLYCIQWKI